MYSEKDIRSILEHWDIENLPVKDIYIMDGAKVSGNVWTVGNDYILKTGKREALIKNLRIAKELHKLGFSSSLPVLTKDGKEYVDNEEIFVLTHGIREALFRNPKDSVKIVMHSVWNTEKYCQAS